MSHLQRLDVRPNVHAESLRVIYESSDLHGWSVATLSTGEDMMVGIRWNTADRLERFRSAKDRDWFILPPEIAGQVLTMAKDLEAARQEKIRRSYAEQAADHEAEAEALEWSEALIGDGFEEG